MKRYTILLISMAFLYACKPGTEKSSDAKWIKLFNGKDLTGWDIKISGYPLNENYMDIFSVQDSILKVSYEKLDSFRGEYGHIYTKQKFSHYRLLVEYRFTGNQCPGGEGWALRNSGAMLHSQPAESVGLDQDFPVCIEAQFLGGLGEGDRTTANVCTPASDIDINGVPVESHCTNSSSKTYHGDQWVTVEMVVLGDSIIHHIIDGDTVISYSRPRVGPEMKPEGYPFPDGTPIREGHIALQAESHNVEFRRVELLDLSADKKPE